MTPEVFQGILIPFAGTTLGAACVLFLKNSLRKGVERALLGFAAGVMVAASVWSLLIPAMTASARLGKFAFVPAVGGFWAGVLFLLLLDNIIPHLHLGNSVPEGPRAHLKKTTMLVLAVTLHNIPEGMAVGVVLAGALAGNAGVTVSGAVALAIGIAIQNFPEGAIVSMPLKSQGNSRWQAFGVGTLSGVVEPIFGLITIALISFVTPILPYLLAFAAGAMIYVVVEELIPESQSGSHSNISTIGVAIGFTLMMVLDVALG